ncbi:transcription antitermination factor NusG [Bradyrhizobium elkanii]|uniref:transcription termination/antitermination NusG family protein n=1 Tax=Bradyrhizobium elkanii TaxID=29448 RepID=UPI0021672F29|nr:transcription termination/antitermination NusG family protein [Bradyrhizobium elkanii]
MSWYVAITNPNCHRRAEVGLADLGYRAFWPKMRKWVSHARTKVSKEYPILGRYLFVEIPDGNFWAVRNVNGIEAILTGDNNAPALVPEAIVWRFRERYMRGEWDFVTNQTGEFVSEQGELVTRRNPIPTGAKIKIMEGEFADLITTVRGRKHGKLEFLANGKWATTRESNARAA